MKQVIGILAAGLTLLFVAVGQAREQPTLAVTPDPAPAYSFFHTEGCGYKDVNYGAVYFPGAVYSFQVVHENGCISFDFETGQSGSYRVEIYEENQGGHLRLVASDTFIVE